MCEKQLQNLHVCDKRLSQLTGLRPQGIRRSDHAYFIVKRDPIIANDPKRNIVSKIHLSKKRYCPDQDTGN